MKAVIANQSNGERYYDHKLTNIEKGELLSIVPTIQKAGIDSKTPYSSVKDKRLVSILQTDEKENARKIKVATGWERGADGKWRYETPDIKYTPVKNIEEGKFYQLSDFVNDKDLVKTRLAKTEKIMVTVYCILKPGMAHKSKPQVSSR